jgi:RNA polymerase sigma-70 factor (ECF subfamily)
MAGLQDPNDMSDILDTILARKAEEVAARRALVPLEAQDRRLWDAAMIGEGLNLLDRAMARRAPGPFQIKAAIAALHAKAARAQDTDWPQIAALYGALLRHLPTPVVRMIAAVAQGMAFGPAHGLRALGGIEGMDDSHYLHAARAAFTRSISASV